MQPAALLACIATLTAAVPCAPATGRNASVLCVAITVKGGQITPAEFTFAPSAAYKPTAGPAFFKLAQTEIAKLANPCNPLLAQGAKPAPAFCKADSAWPAYTTQFLALAATLERTDQASNILSEAGVFRPLALAYHTTPLLFSAVNAEAGILTFRLPDPLDPRTKDTFQIELRGTPNDDTSNRRIVQIRQLLSPLRNQAFCHSRIRARLQAFYKKLKIPIDIVQLDPQGPLLIIQEKP